MRCIVRDRRGYFGSRCQLISPISSTRICSQEQLDGWFSPHIVEPQCQFVDSTAQNVSRSRSPIRGHDNAGHVGCLSCDPHSRLVHDGRHRRCPGNSKRDAGMCQHCIGAHLFRGASGVVHGRQPFRPAAAISLCAGLGDTGLHWPLHGSVHLCVFGLPCHPQG
jgi:hypothetical protein